MSAFVEGALALELPLSKRYFFEPFYLPFYFVLLSYLQVPFYKVSSDNIIAWDGASAKRVELKFGLAFESPLLLFLSFFSIILLLF
jgi:hypothetical protein